MDNVELDKDGNFIVQESILLNIMSGGILLAIFFGVLVTRDFERNNTTESFFLIYLFLLTGVVIFFSKTYRRRIIIVINNNGIYFEKSLLTDWENFVDAYIIQEEYSVNSDSAGISDKFYIVVVFFNLNAGNNYTFKMPMSGSQSKSEYQVISAIEYFSGKKLSYNVL